MLSVCMHEAVCMISFVLGRGFGLGAKAYRNNVTDFGEALRLVVGWVLMKERTRTEVKQEGQ